MGRHPKEIGELSYEMLKDFWYGVNKGSNRVFPIDTSICHVRQPKTRLYPKGLDSRPLCDA